jgi:hypothetical protein
MTGRHIKPEEPAYPGRVQLVIDHPPQCFEPRTWRLYIAECWGNSVNNNNVDRILLRRGERPDYCAECTAAYAAKMKAAGRCFPPLRSAPEQPEASSGA